MKISQRWAKLLARKQWTLSIFDSQCILFSATLPYELADTIGVENEQL